MSMLSDGKQSSKMMGTLQMMELRGDYNQRLFWLEGQAIDPSAAQTLLSTKAKFDWGCNSEGAALLALAICLHLYDEKRALQVYQEFKWKHIVDLPQDNFCQMNQILQG